MLEGLGVKEVSYSKTLKSEDFRLEAEFHIANKMEFDSVKGVEIEAFSQYGTSKELNEEERGFPVLRLNEFDSFFISKPAKCCDLIDKETYLSLRLQKGDVLVCRTNGNPKLVGKAAIVPQNYDYAFASYLYRIRPKTEIINAATLAVYLNSKYGRIEIEKYSMVGNQANFSPAKFRQISIPVFSKTFNLGIERIVFKSFDLSEEGKSLYLKARKMLQDALDLQDWQPSKALFNVKTLKDSFFLSDRLDAEHYQVKYDELEEIIKTVPYKTIAEIQTFNARGVQPDYVEDGSVSVVNSKHILEDGLDYDNFERTTEAFLSSQKRAQIGYGDILIYTTGANIGRTQAYLKNDPALASNHVNILRVKGVNPIYLALVLNSRIGRMQTEKLCTGSAQVEIYPNDIEKFIVPILDETMQETIAEKVQESFAMKAESKRLLNVAKEAVEMAISENEEEAIHYIDENLEKATV